jgi:hypothetical protein
MERNDRVIPSSSAARLLYYVFIALGVALGAALLGRDRTSRVIGTPTTPA